jgi:hypothetical protein
MRHPTEGTLRRLLDEPAGVADADREHAAGCHVCLSRLATAQADAAAAGAALDVDPAVDVDSAWRRLSHSLAAGERVRARPAAAADRWRTALRSPAVATLCVVAVLLGAGAVAAADWVQIFRTERIAPVAITRTDLLELPDLSGYGELEVTREADVREVEDAAAAAAATGLSVPRVRELPRGVTGEPELQVGGKATAVFTFSVEKAALMAAEYDEALPPPPLGLDGSRFRLAAGPGLAAVWGDARDIPALIVARAVAPTAYSSGIPFETARDYFLTLPGLPEHVASQLRGFSGDGRTTLPLPVPDERVRTSTADVGGIPATVLTSRDGTLAGVVWVKDDVVTAVAGSLSEDEVLDVARGLR